MPESPLLFSFEVPTCGSPTAVKKSGSADRPFCGLRLSHDDRPRTARTAVRATPKSGEQSQNVYENKGQCQKVRGLAQTLPLNVCDAPKAQAGEVVPQSRAVPSGHRSLEKPPLMPVQGLGA